MPETITSLIEKLEGAESGSRELDAVIYELQNPTHKPVKGQKGRYFDPEVISALGAEKYITKGTFVAPQYSTSLDAALALAERVLPKKVVNGRPGRLTRLSERFNGTWEAALYRVADGLEQESIAATPALAFCASILKAKELTQ